MLASPEYVDQHVTYVGDAALVDIEGLSFTADGEELDVYYMDTCCEEDPWVLVQNWAGHEYGYLCLDKKFYARYGHFLWRDMDDKTEKPIGRARRIYWYVTEETKGEVKYEKWIDQEEAANTVMKYTARRIRYAEETRKDHREWDDRVANYMQRNFKPRPTIIRKIKRRRNKRKFSSRARRGVP